MPAIIVLMTVGTLALVPWTDFLSSSIRGATADLEREEAYYAADAGVHAIVADLMAAKDPLSPGYEAPEVEVNGLIVQLHVELAPEPSALGGPVLVDPGTGSALGVLGGREQATYTVHDVHRNTPIEANWTFAPRGRWTIAIYEGAGAVGDPLAETSGRGTRGHLVIGGDVVQGGVYTFAFSNDANRTIVTAPFDQTTDSGATWLRLTAHREYLVTSRAGETALTVLVSQSPGPRENRRSVLMASWDTGG